MSKGYTLTPSGPMPVKQLYTLTGGKAYPVDKAYTLTGGTARLWYQRGTPLGTLAVGKTVKIAVGGKDYDWLVAHQGKPSSVYDDSCDGTWLLMKDIYTTSTFGSDNSYKVSSIHISLNGTFFRLIDADIRSAIKQVKIPYTNGKGFGGSVATGSNGLSTKVFLLSGCEVGWRHSDSYYNDYYNLNDEGTRLTYFSDGGSGNSKRVAYNGSSAAVWWLRSPNTYLHSGSVWVVESDGSSNKSPPKEACGVRPCMILPQDALVDDTGHIIA